MRKLQIILLIFSATIGVKAQEIVTPSFTHQELLTKAKPIMLSASVKNSALLSIPFIDDFSSPDIYPNQNLWQGRSVFINNRYPVSPLSIGVATLDAINDTGAHYAGAASFPFGADTLLSLPIRLDSVVSNSIKLSPSDSVFLSFMYQPQGLGNAPEEEDSLVLEFYSPSLDQWFHAWSSAGMSYQAFYNLYGSPFRKVMIAILDTVFFEQGFMFRFTNYASLSSLSLPSFASNVDHWHIDYVHLDYGRSINEPLLNDVAFTSGPGSLLSRYQSIPWTQYLADTLNLMRHDARFRYSKYAGVPEIIDLSFTIRDLVGTSGNYTGFPAVFNYGNTAPFTDTAIIPRPDFSNYYFRTNQTNNGNVDFEVMAWLKPNFSLNLSKINDTLRFYQRFYNYMAYDDGTAEAGYGLSPAGSRLAYKFTLNHPDTLRSIMMYFNQTLNNASQKYFYLTVWNDNGGMPGTVIYEKAGQRPLYENELNRFHTYQLDQPLPLSGSFYIGWRQTTDDNLNVGYDRNTDNKDKIFYNVDGSWLQSLQSGSLLIRPVLGRYNQPFTGISTPISQKGELKVFPNPCMNDEINVIFEDEISASSNITLVITDLQGRIITETAYQSRITLPSISKGMYLIYLTENGKRLVQPVKFIKN